ncbi:hypothetical protein Bbelb_361340 [Branchiostoma belcheri]|nr:hypothetical protein Bbelb_361340 [Branchiostoma belcheri]
MANGENTAQCKHDRPYSHLLLTHGTYGARASPVLARTGGESAARTQRKFYMNLKFYGVSACSQIRWIPCGGGNQTAVSSALSLRRRERLGPPTRPQLPRFGGSPPGQICYVTDQMNRIKAPILLRPRFHLLALSRRSLCDLNLARARRERRTP